MKSSLSLGSVFGIEIGIHYSWLFVFLLVSWSLAYGFFPQQYPGWPGATYWIVGAIASLLLFVSVLIHELAHSLVAKSEGTPVRSITLFIFGGVSNIARESENPKDEFIMAFVGPMSSVVLGVVCGTLWFVSGGFSEQVQAVLVYLAAINLLLAVFNMIPAFPLDGGRVLRALLWWLTNNLRRATQIASQVGQGFAYVLIFGGLLWAFTGNILSGLWLVFIGWFLNSAAEGSYRQMVTQETLKGMHVSDMMYKDVEVVDPEATVRDLVERYILPRNIRALPVVHDSELVGIVTLSDVRDVPQEMWDATRVAEIMTPKENLHVLAPQDDVVQALEALAEQDLNQLPVVDRGNVVGLITRGHIISFLRVRQDLGVK